MNAEEFFRQYALLDPNATDYSVLSFDEREKDAIIAGLMHAIAFSVSSFERNGEDAPVKGSYVVATGLGGIPFAVLQLERVEVFPFALLSMDNARAEGYGELEAYLEAKKHAFFQDDPDFSFEDLVVNLHFALKSF